MQEWLGIQSTNDPRWASYLDEVKRVLRGKELDQLHRSTEDGLGIRPIYLAEDAAFEVSTGWSGVRGLGADRRGWRVRGLVLASDPTAARRDLQDDRTHGCDGVLVVLDPSVRGRDEGWAAGVGVRRPSELQHLFEGVDLDGFDVSLEAGLAGPAATASLMANAPTPSGCGGCDGFATWARHGGLPVELDAWMASVASLVQRAPEGFRPARIDANVWAEAGASAEQQIAAAAAAAVETWRAWHDRGVDPSQAVACTELRVSLSPDVLETVARIRATRRVFDRIFAVLGVEGALFVEGMVDRGRLTGRDVHTNLIRLGAATAAGAVAGVQAMVAVPFDLAHGGTDAVSRRLARNGQLVLREESNLGRVFDPAGGSYYVESRTEALAEAGWARFRQFEAEGGLQQALSSGRWQAELAERKEARRRGVQRRRPPIIGVSTFPDPSPQPAAPAMASGVGGAVVVDDAAELLRRVEADAPLVESGADWVPKKGIEATPFVRWSGDFEALQARAEQRSRRPAVFLANLGSRVDFSARSTWISDLVRVGGFEVVDTDGFDDAAAAKKAFADSGADLACICGTDEALTASAKAFAEALSGHGPVLVAGRWNDAYDGAPIQRALGIQDDALEVLQDLWERVESKQ